MNAVLAAGVRRLWQMSKRASPPLAAVRPTRRLRAARRQLQAHQNILKQANFKPSGPVQASLLEAGPEARSLRRLRYGPREVRGAGYEEALEQVASLRPQVDLFFDKVLVNAPDPKVRANRLTLLQQHC